MRVPPPVVAARAAALLVAATLAVHLAGARASAQPSLDALWQAYWRADSPKAAAAESEKLLQGGVTFDDAWARLHAGRSYASAPTGPRSLRFSARAGVAYDNAIDVPAESTTRRSPGRCACSCTAASTSRTPKPGGAAGGNRLPGEPQIVVEPFGWRESAWWHASQVDNILALVDRVKRQYNIDESHIYLTGTSDGGTGAYFLAMREPTPSRRCCRSSAISACWPIRRPGSRASCSSRTWSTGRSSS